jgi:tetratricopeptide (TPR) repeat protein
MAMNPGAGRAALAMVLIPLALVGLAAAPVAAQRTPPLTREQALEDLKKPDVDARRRAAVRLGDLGVMADVPILLQALRDQDPVVQALVENSIWLVWSRSGDAQIDALFQVGLEQLNRRAGPAAVETFTRIIEKKPDFAEGWNKRATMYFLMGEYEKSLRDCDEVMKRNPAHFGALAGYGQIYLHLGQPERALDYFQRALAVNPNLLQVEMAVEQLKQVLIQKRRDTL